MLNNGNMIHLKNHHNVLLLSTNLYVVPLKLTMDKPLGCALKKCC